jgi:hypothetical protein
MRLEDTRNSIKFGDPTELRAARLECSWRCGDAAFYHRWVVVTICHRRHGASYQRSRHSLTHAAMRGRRTRLMRQVADHASLIFSRLCGGDRHVWTCNNVEPTRARTIEAYTPGAPVSCCTARVSFVQPDFFRQALALYEAFRFLPPGAGRFGGQSRSACRERRSVRPCPCRQRHSVRPRPPGFLRDRH